MKKTGFTLSELLITLTVIGVVSALVLPAVSGILPDKNKAKIIKYHAELNNVINSIMTDDSVYRPFTGYDNNGTTFLTTDGKKPCVGLNCVTYDSGDSNKTQFQNLLEDRFIKKVSIDGSKWDVLEAAQPTGAYILEVVTDGKDGTDQKKAFEKNAPNKNINTFYFNIDEYGNVKPGDALTEAFLKNYKVLNDREADKGDADTILDEISKNTRKDYYTKKTTSN